MKRMNQHGSSLLIVILVTAVVAITAAAAVDYQIERTKKERAERVKPAIKVFKEQLVSLVSSPRAWSKTQARNASAFARAERASVSVGSRVTTNNQNQDTALNIYGEDDTSLFYSSADPTAGFDMNGKKCVVNLTSDNSQCPFRYRVSLENRSFVNGRWIDLVRFQLVLNSSKNLPPINPSNPEFSFIMNRSYSGEAGVQALCQATGGTYNDATARCSTQLTQEADCNDQLVYRGPASTSDQGVCALRQPSSVCPPGQAAYGVGDNSQVLCRAVPGSV
ncbi:MAG: hypothetical protein EOP06_01380 [Proteobacteria bacterium]|nr:MAG: hypothetical protein EOP06_01380 [Pseudomonadota bacterium]